VTLDPKLLGILACPVDKGALLYFPEEDTLYNPRLKRRYFIKQNIPIMLVGESQVVDEKEHERLMALSKSS